MTSPKYTIFWLDDELTYYMSMFATEIAADGRFHLIQARDIDKALLQLEDADFKPHLLIWDMILPPGRLGLDATKNGLGTGELFYLEFRRKFPSTPAILFTNVLHGNIHDRFNSPETNSYAWKKKELLAPELIAKIEEVLGIKTR